MTDMTAQQARICIEGYHRTVVENELKNIKKKIEEAIGNGEECIHLHKSLSQDTKKILKNLGYKINKNDSEIDITW